MKYTSKVCFTFSVALGNGVGTQLELIEYTRKKIVLHMTLEKLVQDEIKRVKKYR